jgi:phage baseplate assembly protein W
MAFGIGPKLTLAPTEEDGAYGLLKNISEVAKQNMKMIVLTNPGERVMDINFGVGLKRYLFELSNTEIKQVIRQRIADQVSKYLPYVRVSNIGVFTPRGNDNGLAVRIEYTIPSSGLSRQTMDIKVS